MTRLQALKELARKVEAGEWTHRKSTYVMAGFGDGMGHDMVRAYNGSLDAAQALHETLLPEWVTWDKSHTYFGYEVALTNGNLDANGCSKVSEARAWLLAILKALIAQEETGT